MTKTHSTPISRQEFKATVTGTSEVLIDEHLLTDQTLAAYIHIEPRTIRRWRNERGLPFLRISSRVIRYKWGDVRRWLDAQRTIIGEPQVWWQWMIKKGS